MTCMCGDINCPSCGPAQGYDPAFELVCEWMQESVLADFPQGIDTAWLSEELANRLGHRDQPPSLADEIYRTAQAWSRKNLEASRARQRELDRRRVESN